MWAQGTREDADGGTGAVELWARGRRAPHAAVPVPVGLGARFCLLPCSVRRWPQQPGLCVFWWSRLGGWGRSQPVGPRGARFRGAEGGGEGPSAPARSSGLTAAVPGQSPAEKLRQGARLPRAAGNGAGQRPPETQYWGKFFETEFSALRGTRLVSWWPAPELFVHICQTDH